MDRALVPEEDEDVPGFWRALGLPGLADVHVHFLPPRLLRRVWQYFDEAGPLVGVSWPIRYKWSDEERVAHLQSMGTTRWRCSGYRRRSAAASSPVTRSRGRAGLRCPSRPVMSWLATSALTTASSHACTTAS
jgi:cytosine/adenosine deaminase-related metal-dependent hydrolase